MTIVATPPAIRSTYNVKDYGAKCDGLTRVASGSITSGSAVLTDIGLPAPTNSTFFQASTGGTIAASVTRYYRVSAINAYGETLASTETSIAINAGTNTNTVTVTWNAVIGSTGYKIYAASSSGAEGLIGTQTSPFNSWSDPGTVTPGAAPPSSNTTMAGAFTVADVGKLITVANTSSATTPTATTILSYQNANQVTLAQNAAITGTNVTYSYGTNDTVAIQAAITAASANIPALAPTVVVPGFSAITDGFIWHSGVSLIGNGTGHSKLMPMAVVTQAVIQGFAALNNPFTDVVIRDIELDGSGIPNSSYNVAWKGLYLQNCLRLIVRNCYVHDFPATGIGCDYLVDSLIEGNIVNNNGRLNSGSQLGGSGIGIGTGLYSVENSTVAHNHCTGNKRFGIFWERQTSTYSQYAKAIGNHCYGNGDAGIGDCGTRRFTAVGNSCVSNSKDGIVMSAGTVVTLPGYEGLLEGNNCVGNGQHGIQYDNSLSSALGRYTFRGNRSVGNTKDGIRITGGTNALPNMVVDTNDIHDNGATGIRVANSTGGCTYLQIMNNHVWGNGTTDVAGVTQGIRIDIAVTSLTVKNNRCYDPNGTKKQTYGLQITSGVTITGAEIVDNDLRDNLTAGLNQAGTITSGVIRNNLGYNPVGAATTSVSASPWTYTAGPTPEVLYLIGGTITTVTKGGITLSGTSFVLAPNEAAIVTYSVAPTAAVDKQ